MWWRFLVFCILVTLVLFVVLSCIYGKPAVHLFFHRCCSDDIENDQVIFEHFGNNFLRERLVSTEEYTSSLFSEDADEGIDSTPKISFKDLVRALRNTTSTDSLGYKDVVKASNDFLFSFKGVENVKNNLTQPVHGKNVVKVENLTIKNDFSTEPLLGKDVAEVQNVTLFSFEDVDKEFKNDLATESLVGKDSMEVENQLSFAEVGKAIDDMITRLINDHNPSTRDGEDELEAVLMTDEDVSEVTTERLRKRS